MRGKKYIISVVFIPGLNHKNEYLFRQVLAQGHRKPPQHFINLIDRVTRDDINRIGEKMLASKVSLAGIGTLKKLPSFNDIELGLLDKQVFIIILSVLRLRIAVSDSQMSFICENKGKFLQICDLL